MNDEEICNWKRMQRRGDATHRSETTTLRSAPSSRGGFFSYILYKHFSKSTKILTHLCSPHVIKHRPRINVNFGQRKGKIIFDKIRGLREPDHGDENPANEEGGLTSTLLLSVP